MKLFIYLLSLSYLLCTSCCTPDDPLADCKADPNCEYFECLVDGEKWVPSCTADPLFGCDPFDVQYYKDIPALSCYIENANIGQTIALLGRRKLIKGRNTLHKQSFFSLGNSSCQKFDIDSLAEQIFNINLVDTVNFIIEGDLNLKFTNECNEIKLISNAKFRWKYRY